MKIAHGTLLAAAGWALGLVLPLNADESLHFANSFGRSMVLQRDMPVPVWGWAAAQSEVTVSFKAQHKTARADADGRWRVLLDAMPADANASSLHVEAAGEKVSAEDVVVGDVWLCAGPGIPRSMSRLQYPRLEIAKAKFPEVRIMRPDTYTSVVPVADIPTPTSWVPVTPQSIAPFSVTWYFGRELHLASGGPVGLILVNREGMAREWIAWKLDPKDKSQTYALKQLQEKLPHDIARAESWLFNMEKRRGDDPVDLLLYPCHIPFNFYGVHPVFGVSYPIGYKSYLTYNACVVPLVPMALRGVLFHCEFDDNSAVAADDLKQVVQSWRDAWGRPGLPFVFSEPVLKQGKAASVDAALKIAMTLPGVMKVAKPQSFSEQKSEEYWKTLAMVAKDVPQEQARSVPPHTTWPQPSIVKTEPAPTRRKLEAAHVFADNMVLQCDQPIQVWGWCNPATPGNSLESTERFFPPRPNSPVPKSSSPSPALSTPR